MLSPNCLPLLSRRRFLSDVAAMGSGVGLMQLLARDGKVHLNLEDQVVRETLASHRGEVINPRMREMLNLPPLTPPPEGSPPVDHLAGGPLARG